MYRKYYKFIYFEASRRLPGGTVLCIHGILKSGLHVYCTGTGYVCGTFVLCTCTTRTTAVVPLSYCVYSNLILLVPHSTMIYDFYLQVLPVPFILSLMILEYSPDCMLKTRY